ncbi:MAG: LamG domain-containing protein [Planctomycetota bacterium]|jgi:hypothetical protein
MRRCIYILAVVVCSAAGITVTGPAVAERIKSVEELAGPWQLFIDDYLIASKSNVRRRYHPFRKYPANPLIVVDRPWEDKVVAVLAVLPSEDRSGFRMYYYCWTEDKQTKKRGSFMCYAVSKDGLKWEKRNLGLYKWKVDGTKNNNILPNAPAAVMYTPWATDPDRRYHGVGGRYHARVSADGIHWRSLSDESIVSGGDTSHFYWDPHTKKFRCTVKVGATVGGLRRRAVGFSETTDLTKFSPLRLIMAPDDFDDRWCKPGTVARTHFYACPVFAYETMYVGLLQIYRAEDAEGYFHGPLWLEMVSSRDGIHFLREEDDRPPLLDIGKFRQFDEGMVLAPPPVRVGDEIWLYYTGCDGDHDVFPYKSAIGLAKLRKDGFASLDADESLGEILTKKFADVGGTLQVNYNARGGSLRIEVLDKNNQVIPGYGREDCEPLTSESIRQAVTWQSKKTLPTDLGPVRFRFLLEHASLYSFMPGKNARPLDEPGSPELQALYTFEGDRDPWSDMLAEDGLQLLYNLGTCRLDSQKAPAGTNPGPAPAFGKRSLVIGSYFRPWNRVEIQGTKNLDRHFTLAAMVKSTNNKHARLFSAYRGNYPPNSSELIFDFDPRGRILGGMRLFCKGIPVESDNIKFDDSKYHHLAVVYDDGTVTFYLDGNSTGQQWLPGGEPVQLARNLLIGEDAMMGTDEQLHGNVDDVLILGRALGPQEVAALSQKGATVFFGLHR